MRRTSHAPLWCGVSILTLASAVWLWQTTRVAPAAPDRTQDFTERHAQLDDPLAIRPGTTQHADLRWYAESDTPTQRLTTRYGDRAVSWQHADGWSISMRLARFGRTDAWTVPAPVVPRHGGVQVEYPRAQITEWYRNTARGVEQGFTLPARPEGAGPLRVELRTEGLRPVLTRDAQAIRFTNTRGVTLARYDKLAVFDARGARVPAHMEVRDRTLSLVVADGDAPYPLVIDPMLRVVREDVVFAPEGTDAKAGGAVARSGDWLFVGAPEGNGARGAVLVFSTAPGATTKSVAVIAPPADAADLGAQFGSAIAVDGDLLAIGAPRQPSTMMFSPPDGAVFLYQRQGSTWTHIHTIRGPGGDTDFGASVALYGGVLAVGEPGASVTAGSPSSTFSNAGQVHLFGEGQAWSNLGPTVHSPMPVSGERFGAAVQLWGQTPTLAQHLAVGAPGASGAGVPGTVRVFYVPSGDWQSAGTQPSGYTASLQPVRGGPAPATPGFGSALAYANGTLVVGSPLEDNAIVNPPVKGNAYALRYNGNAATGPVGWDGSPMPAPVSMTYQTMQGWGRAVATDGAVVAISTPATLDGTATNGAVCLFREVMSAWSEEACFQHEDAALSATLQFGAGLAMDGTSVFVGAPGADSASGQRSGDVREYWKNQSAWTLDRTFAPDRAGQAVSFGRDILTRGKWTFVTSPNQTRRASPGGAWLPNAGVVLVYEQTGQGMELRATLAPSTPTRNAEFGVSITFMRDILFVGEPGYGGGRGRVHSYIEQGGTWSPSGNIPASGNAEGFGASLTSHDDLLVIGAPGHGFADPTTRGEVVVYTFDANLTPTNPQTIAAPTSEVGQRFGDGLAIHGDSLAIGAPMLDADGQESVGRVYLYRRDPNLGTWSQNGDVRPPQSVAYTSFGYAMAMNSKLLAIPLYQLGPPERSEVIITDHAGQPKARPTSALPYFGTGVSLDEQAMLVGAENAAVLYTWTGDTPSWDDASTFSLGGGEFTLPEGLDLWDNKLSIGLLTEQRAVVIETDRLFTITSEAIPPFLQPTFTLRGQARPNTVVSVLLDGDQDSSGIAMTEPDGSWKFTPEQPIPEGQYAMLINGNLAGRSSNTIEAPVTIDGTPPKLTASSPRDGATVDENTPKFTLETDEPVVRAQLWIGNPDPNNDPVKMSPQGEDVLVLTWPTALADGPHTFTAELIDRAGNRSTTDITITVSASSGGVTITSPAADATLDDETPTFRGTTQAGARLVFTLDDAELATIEDAPETWFLDAPDTITEGPHTLSVAATDGAGNTTTASVDFVMDATAPVVTFDNLDPRDDSVTGNPTARGEGAEAETMVTVATTRARMDGGAEDLGTATTPVRAGGAWVYTPEPALAPGEYTMTFTVTLPEHGPDTVTRTITVKRPADTRTSKRCTAAPPNAPAPAWPLLGAFALVGLLRRRARR